VPDLSLELLHPRQQGTDVLALHRIHSHRPSLVT
jgi:hypothetical protein